MPIARLIADGRFTPEQRHVIELAFKSTPRNLKLVDRNDPICEIVAQKVIKIAEKGVADVLAITEIATRELSVPKE